MDNLILERKCVECGKTIYPTKDWIYKIPAAGKHKVKWYCSYTCWRKNGGGSSVRRTIK